MQNDKIILRRGVMEIQSSARVESNERALDMGVQILFTRQPDQFLMLECR